MDDVSPVDRAASAVRRSLPWLRTAAFAAIALVLAVLAARAVPDIRPTGPLMRYVLQAAPLAVIGVGGVATWWAMRRGATWDADLWPALLGGLAAFSILAVLSGTPYGPGGLQGDQTFRTETITRFADSWSPADFTYQGLPPFYAPAYFWVLGRIADLAAIEPWRMIKYGTVVTAMGIPVLTYVLWSRQVAPRLAALIAAVPLLVQNYYEPYAWLVIVAIVPWWVETVLGHTRQGVARWHPIILGLIGALLFLTYYYFFFMAALAVVIHLLARLLFRQPDGFPWRRAVAAGVVFLVATSIFWLPLAVSLAAADDPASRALRYFRGHHGVLPTPFLQVDPIGLLTFAGLAFLVLTARHEVVSRGLLAFLGAAYAWYLIGLPAALIGYPILTFRVAPLVPLILLSAGILGLARVARFAMAQTSGRDVAVSPATVRTLSALVALVFLLYAGRTFTTTVASSRLLAPAHDEPLPNGEALPWSGVKPDPGYVSAVEIEQAIDDGYRGDGNPVVLSTRADVLALKPHYGFVQWHVFYSHPAAGFAARIAFLEELAASATPAEFAMSTADNEFDPIDAFVLRTSGEQLLFEYADDAFPDGSVVKTIAFPRSLFDPEVFDVTDLGAYVVVARR